MGIVVADLYQLSRVNGEYSKESKRLLRKGAKIEDDFVEEMNRTEERKIDGKTKEVLVTGKYYEIDKAATEKFYEDQEKNQEKKERDASLRKATSGEALQGLLASAAGISQKKTEKPADSGNGKKEYERTGEEVIADILKAETVFELEKLIEGDERKGVLKAFDKRKAELEKPGE